MSPRACYGRKKGQHAKGVPGGAADAIEESLPVGPVWVRHPRSSAAAGRLIAMSRPEWIEVGRISRPHGVHGEVRIVPDSDNPERFTPGSVLHARLRRKGIAGRGTHDQVTLTVETVRGDGAFPIVSFKEVADRNQAEALRGYALEVGSSQLPQLEDDEFYPFDLEGLAVRDASGTNIGRVKSVVESPAHAILVVALASGGEAMVPFVYAAVPVVAVAQGFLVIGSDFLSEGTGGGVSG